MDDPNGPTIDEFLAFTNMSRQDFDELEGMTPEEFAEWNKTNPTPGSPEYADAMLQIIDDRRMKAHRDLLPVDVAGAIPGVGTIAGPAVAHALVELENNRDRADLEEEQKFYEGKPSKFDPE